MSERGPNDLEEMNAKLKKQVEFMQAKCRQAGKAILDQESTIFGFVPHYSCFVYFILHHQT